MKHLITGRVISGRGDKTIVIKVVMRKTHPLYKKQYTVHRKFMAHDQDNQASVGDLVTIKETRPISARKRFILDEVIEKAGVGFEETDVEADVPRDEIEKKTQPKSAKSAKAKPKQGPEGKA